MKDGVSNPLVSIIVRTKDRPKLLKRALRSIAAQTYRPIEVVLVNDGGCDLDIDELCKTLGDVRLNYVRLEENKGRAHAGNVGLVNAMGDYIGFLDDDDEFYPNHVETLVHALVQNVARVAYSSVEMIDEASGTRKRLFSETFSHSKLIIENYIPLNAPLFQSELLKSLRFDESFDLYEDWDMLIRAGAESSFYFVGKITAAYNQGDASQVAFVAPEERIQRETIKLYEKHRDKIPLEHIVALRWEVMRSAAALFEKDRRISWIEEKLNDSSEEIRRLEELVAIRNERVEALEQSVRELTERANNLRNYIEAIHSGRTWRLVSKCLSVRERLLSAVFRKKAGTDQKPHELSS